MWYEVSREPSVVAKILRLPSPPDSLGGFSHVTTYVERGENAMACTPEVLPASGVLVPLVPVDARYTLPPAAAQSFAASTPPSFEYVAVGMGVAESVDSVRVTSCVVVASAAVGGERVTLVRASLVRRRNEVGGRGVAVVKEDMALI